MLEHSSTRSTRLWCFSGLATANCHKQSVVMEPLFLHRHAALTLQATMLSFKQARNVQMGLLSWKLQDSSPLTLHFMIQYLLVWRVHADIPCDTLYSSQHRCDNLRISSENILRRGKINQCTRINTVKVDRKYKQHICCRNQSWVVEACSVKAQMLPFLSCLTLFRTMQSAASAGKGYRIVSFFPFWTQWSRANAATSNEARCGCAIAAQGGDYWFSDYGYCRGVEWMANSSLSLTAMAAGT